MKTEQIEKIEDLDKVFDSKSFIEREGFVEENHLQNLRAWNMARKNLKNINLRKKSIMKNYFANIEKNMVGEYLDPAEIKQKMISNETPVPYSSITSTMDYLENRGVLKESYGFYKITDFGSKFISSVKTISRISELNKDYGVVINYDKENPDSSDIDSYKITLPKNFGKF